jgi:hypothetical protein
MYHHFKGDKLSRSEYIQRYAVERILQNSLQDAQRESSKVWELKHASSCLQVGRLLALKRGLSLELAEIICVLHDIAVIETGSYIDHAKKGAEIAKKILEENGRFKAEEIELICSAIAHHSEKEVYSDDPYVELVKDADVYDCSLYEGTASYYKEHKSADVCSHYAERVKQVSAALGLPVRPDFKL